MKKQFYILTYFALFFTIYLHAQDKGENPVFLKISGLQVTIMQSDTFSIDYYSYPESEIESYSKGDTIVIMVVDQTGRVPKGNVTIYTNKINYLSLHNSKLICPEQISTDIMDISISSSSGYLKIKADSLKIILGGGASLKVDGSVDMFEGDVGGFSRLNAKNLLSSHAKIFSFGHSILEYNSKEVLVLKKDENSKTRNHY